MLTIFKPSLGMLDSSMERLILSGPFFHINLYRSCIVLSTSGDGFGSDISRWLSFDKISVFIIVMRPKGVRLRLPILIKSTEKLMPNKVNSVEPQRQLGSNI